MAWNLFDLVRWLKGRRRPYRRHSILEVLQLEDRLVPCPVNFPPGDPNPPPPNNPGETQEPVFLQSGELTYSHVDLDIPGRGFDWKFERTYRSGLSLDSWLGNNWDF